MKPLYLYISIIFLFSLSACKKEYPALPYNDILSFSVKDANGAQLKAVIENDEIILYWPVGQTIPEEITPSIIVAEKASVSPASGTKVSFKESVTYTVTAEDGSITSYKLKPIVNSLLPMIKTFSGIRIYNSKSFIIKNLTVQVSGDLFDISEGKTKVFFTNSSGQDIAVGIVNMTPIAINLDPNVATGSYLGVKVVSGNKSSFFQQAFDIIVDSRPLISSTSISATSTVKRNGQVTITGGENLDKISAVELYNSVTGTFIAVNLKGTTSNSVTLEIPVTFPLGDSNRIRYYYPASEYFPAGIGQLNFINFPIKVVE